VTTVAAAGKGTHVVVGLTSACPYGLSACWGGAHEALGRLEGVDVVNHIASASDSTAEVWLKDNGLPQLDRWVDRFSGIVNERYGWRGVEVTMRGAVEERNGSLFLAADQHRAAVKLGPLQATDKIQWDSGAGTPEPLQAGEAEAYRLLAERVSKTPAVGEVTVTGPLTQTPSGYVLEVRESHG
jgi:hypothetical protein